MMQVRRKFLQWKLVYLGPKVIEIYQQRGDYFLKVSPRFVFFKKLYCLKGVT